MSAQRILVVNALFGVGAVPIRGFQSDAGAQAFKGQLQAYHDAKPDLPFIGDDPDTDSSAIMMDHDAAFTKWLNGHPLPAELRFATGFSITSLDVDP